MTRALFLYTELASYFYSCVQKLEKNYEIEAKIFTWPVNEQAPFKFLSSEKIQIHEKVAYSFRELLHACIDFKPNILIVSGWADKDYMKVAHHFRKQGIPIICGMDNQWDGRLKQRLASFIGPLIFPQYFSHIWVPGLYQYEYARRLGFSRRQILTGLYCADERFSQAYQQIREKKRQKFLHRFLYVGRLVPEKATLMLYNAFKELVNEGYHEWKLEFIGTGPEAEYIKANENIDIRGFIAPEELPPLAAEGGCMILPSIHEPWGVSIHEFAAAGLPIIASDVVGAATAFVRN